MTQQLRDTFVAHEHLTPDADLALEAIQHRIRTRHRSRVAVTSAVVAVAGVVAGASLVVGGTHGRGPAHTSAAQQPSVPPARTALPAPDHVTIAAGWLPAGPVHAGVIGNGFGQQYRSYNVTTEAGWVYVLLETEPGTALPTSVPHKNPGTPHDVRLGGHTVREWSGNEPPSWYHAAFVLPGGRVATVGIDGGDGSAATLVAIGRHVLTTMRFDRHDPIRTGYQVGYLPPGVVVKSVSMDDTNNTYYVLAPPSATSNDAIPSYGTSEARTIPTPPAGAPAKPNLPAQPGRPVQGHPTRTSAGSNPTSLWIDGVRPGVSIQVHRGPGVTTVEQLYRIADGLILR